MHDNGKEQEEREKIVHQSIHDFRPSEMKRGHGRGHR